MIYIYEIILLITLLKSIVLVRKFSLSSQNYLFVYLLITFLIELSSWVIILIKKDWSFQYTVYCVFCIAFFWFYYTQSFQKKLRKKVHFVSGLISLSVLLFSFFSKEEIGSLLIIALPIFYIVFSIFWFYQKIALPSESKITNDPNFWISTGLLLWSCFFIFRVVPRDFFNIEDQAFLELLREFLYAINCVMYLLFFKALIEYETIAKNIKK